MKQLALPLYSSFVTGDSTCDYVCNTVMGILVERFGPNINPSWAGRTSRYNLSLAHPWNQDTFPACKADAGLVLGYLIDLSHWRYSSDKKNKILAKLIAVFMPDFPINLID